MKPCISVLIAVLLLGCSAEVPEKSEGEQTQSPAKAAKKAGAPSIPGTSVCLSPPAGFVPADRFPGFMKKETGSSIVVTEIPGPYEKVTADFRDKEKMQAGGMTLLDHSSVKVDGQRATLLRVEQSAYGTVFGKWMLAVERPDGTTVIAASFPKAKKEQGEALRAAILAATFSQPSDPADALTFVATPVAPFEVAKVIGQAMVLSPDGRFPVKDENVPFMILGMSASEGLVIANQKAFAERRIKKAATIENITVEEITPITIGPLSGYATTAKGIGEGEDTPLTIYQVILFDQSGYSMIQGITPTAQKDTYVPLFEKIAKTFRMKQ